MTTSLEAQRTMQDGHWATPYTLEPGQTQYHELSHTRVWVTLLEQEWQIRYQRMPDEDSHERWLQRMTNTLPDADMAAQRFVRNDDGNQVRYLPAMSSLATVIRPHQPLTIPADSECTIYVGTLLWMRIHAGTGGTHLMELPLADPSLTWVGRTTMEGELCYSAATFARLVLDAVPKRPWRAITPVRIVNERREPLLLERFNLPTPLLSLHRNDKDQLWTPGVTVTCETDMNSARLKIDQKLITAAGNCELVAPAREQSARGGLIRAYDRIFG